MNWTIEFHRKAEEEIDALPKSLRSKLRTLIGDIRTRGFEALPAKSVKHVEDGIRELRVKSNDGIARSLYVTETECRFCVLLAFVKKTEETPRRYIELAKTRRSEMQ